MLQIGLTQIYLATIDDGQNFNAALPTIQEYFGAMAAMAFSGRAIVKLGTEDGLWSYQIQKSMDVLHSAMNNPLTTYPGSQSVLD